MNIILSLLKNQIIKYLIVGGTNTLFTGIIFFVAFKICHIHYLISLTVSWFFGILLTYVLNYLWVFQPEERLRFQERFAKYFFTYVISLVINIVLLHTIVKLFLYDAFYVQVALIPLIVVMNFTLTKYWSLRRLR